MVVVTAALVAVVAEEMVLAVAVLALLLVV
jgi:hypothetical protein